VVRSGSARTLYLDDDPWSCLLELVKLGYAQNVSQLVNGLLADALGKLDTASKPENLDYEILKKRHLNLSRELVRLEKHMKDYGGDYEALVGLAEDFRLDFEPQIASALHYYLILFPFFATNFPFLKTFSAKLTP